MRFSALALLTVVSVGLTAAQTQRRLKSTKSRVVRVGIDAFQGPCKLLDTTCVPNGARRYPPGPPALGWCMPVVQQPAGQPYKISRGMETPDLKTV